MAKAQNSISNFLAQVSSRGLAKPNKFEVIIDQPACVSDSFASRLTNLFCDSAFLPMTQIFTTRQQIYGPPSFHPVGVNYGGDNMTLNFLLDREMHIKKYFDNWMDGIVDRTSHHTSYQSAYLTNMTIRQLDENDSVTYEIKIIDAFPTTVNVLTLDNNLGGTVHKLPVTFNFRRWESQAISPDPAPEETKSTPQSSIQIQNGKIYNNLAPKRLDDRNGTQDLGGGAASSRFLIT